MRVFIFRRDLRKQDNTGPNTLIKEYTHTKTAILPIFIFDPVQIDSSVNQYFSHSAVQFMHESLEDLSRNLSSHLHCFHGPVTSVLSSLFEALPQIVDVTVNEDYTPFSRHRDADIQKLCQRHKKQFHTYEDIPLGDFKSVKTGAGQPYKKFKFFHQKIVQQPLRSPEVLRLTKSMLVPQSATQTVRGKVPVSWLAQKYTRNSNLLVTGGRKAAIARLRRALPQHHCKRIVCTPRSIVHPTTLLSAPGNWRVSVREVCAFLSPIVSLSSVIRQII